MKTPTGLRPRRSDRGRSCSEYLARKKVAEAFEAFAQSDFVATDRRVSAAVEVRDALGEAPGVGHGTERARECGLYRAAVAGGEILEITECVDDAVLHLAAEEGAVGRD